MAVQDYASPLLGPYRMHRARGNEKSCRERCQVPHGQLLHTVLQRPAGAFSGMPWSRWMRCCMLKHWHNAWFEGNPDGPDIHMMKTCSVTASIKHHTCVCVRFSNYGRILIAVIKITAEQNLFRIRLDMGCFIEAWTILICSSGWWTIQLAVLD